MNNPKWKSYEDVAAYLLNQFSKEFGISLVERTQTVEGHRSKTTWNIDAKAFLADGEGFLIVECRRYTTSKQNQEKVGGLAYRILDSGAKGGIIVSPTGLQYGAEKIARAENIISVELDENSTPYEFGMRFLNNIFVGIQSQLIASDFFEDEVLRTCIMCGVRFTAFGDEQTCQECSR
jgi:hypothetical protein